MAEKVLKAGFIGYGGIAGSHQRGYTNMKQEGGPVLVEAFCDLRPEQLAKAEGRTYTDIDEFLRCEADKLDYVDICLPTYLHAETAIKAMKLGLNVLSEKPMALNYEQASSMCETAAATGRKLMIAHCNRFMNAKKITKSYIDSGELGKVRSADFFREGGRRTPFGYNGWVHKKELSGGGMLDTHVHDVDVIVWMFGMPNAVSALARNEVAGSGYDSMSVNYRYDSGIFVHAGCDWTTEANKYNSRGHRINLEGGYIFYDGTAGRKVLTVVKNDGTVTDLTDRIVCDSYEAEIRYFAECLLEDKPVDACPPEQSAKAIALIMAEMQSADRGGEFVSPTV